MKNYYEILGVSKDANQEDIKKIYRKLALEYHPDRNPEGADKFKEIAEAYEVLSDENRRREYNHRLENPMAGNPFGGNPFGDGNIDDILNQMFGSNFGQQQRRHTPEKVIDIDIDIFESFNGVVKDITYGRKIDCNGCKGTGGQTSGCITCGGQGFVLQRIGTGMFTQVIKSVCNQCNGNGYTVISKCHSCNGSAHKEIMETIRVTFPRGIDNGQSLRVGQKGDFLKGMMGDLILRVRLNSTNGFEKNGNDLIYNAFFSLDDLKNNEFEIPHPSGKLSVKFPKDFNTQIPLRIKQKGFTTNTIGDLFIKYNVKYIRS